MMQFRGRSRTPAFVAVVIATAIQGRQAIAQTGSSNAGLQGGQDGMFDAILATPNYRTVALRLLTRTTRSVSPTEVGERLLHTIGPRSEEIET